MANKKSKQARTASAPSDVSTSSSDQNHATSPSSSGSSDTASERASVAPSEKSSETVTESARIPEQPADFDSWYLRQLTAEFGDDLDKVRNANDFTDASLPILIQALKQCSSVYSEEQKRKALGLGGEDEGSR